MSQSETYVPGMNTAAGQGTSNNLYSRQTAQISTNYTANGTYVPDIKNSTPEMKPFRQERSLGEPVVGFLYSISRMGIGEYWPLHLGTNTIGRSANCDIQLKEASVSDNHATLSIKQMKSTNALIASIRDTGSKNGIYLNDEELDYDNHACKNLDVLTIGSCYKLLVMLVNSSEYGLSVAKDFVPFEDASQEDILPQTDNLDNNTTQSQRRFLDDGTIDIYGNKGFAGPGETKIM